MQSSGGSPGSAARCRGAGRGAGGLRAQLPGTSGGYVCTHSVTWVHLLAAAFFSPRKRRKTEKVSVCCRIVRLL